MIQFHGRNAGCWSDPTRRDSGDSVKVRNLMCKSNENVSIDTKFAVIHDEGSYAFVKIAVLMSTGAVDDFPEIRNTMFDPDDGVKVP